MISRLARLMMLAKAGIKQVALPAAKLRLLQRPKGPQLIWNSASFSYARAHCAGIGNNSEGGQPKWLQERHPDGRNRWNPCRCKAAKDATLSLSKYLQIFRDCTAGFLFFSKRVSPTATAILAQADLQNQTLCCYQWLIIEYRYHTRYIIMESKHEIAFASRRAQNPTSIH